MPETLAREIEIDRRRIPYLLRRSPRARRLRADLDLRSGLRVTLPPGVEEAAADRFLRQKRRWLLRALGRLERLARMLPDRPLSHGSSVPFLGTDLRLDLNVGDPRVGRLGDALIVHVPRRTRGLVRAALASWYAAQAARELAAMAEQAARHHGLRYRRIRIGAARSRWGSCSSSGALTFNWRLMLAPKRVAAYLVAHELAHLEHPDHSPRFWAAVERIHPTYRDEEGWLKRFGPGLDL